jgi:predicted SnoaL-like aldol condensation-catalyzing enzyme
MQAKNFGGVPHARKPGPWTFVSRLEASNAEMRRTRSFSAKVHVILCHYLHHTITRAHRTFLQSAVQAQELYSGLKLANAIALEKMTTLYINVVAHIPPGRDGLFNLIRGAPPNMRYESGLTLANGDHVIVHGRFSNIGLPKNWIAADIVRIADRVLDERWDVLEDEATRAESQSGLPMFGEKFPE